jgi:hypothetical protein
MTPEEFIDEIGRLVASRRDQDALDLAARVGPSVKPALTFDQLDQVSGLLEGAALVPSLS